MVVEGWLSEEGVYLRGLLKEPLQETWEMEYYTAVVKLRDSEQVTHLSVMTLHLLSFRWKLAAANEVWSNLTASSISKRDMTQSIETARRHAIESHHKEFQAVQILEKKMGITSRWEPESVEWKEAAEKVVKRRYQRCIDNLEGLVVARMFELTKMNMSQTGSPISSVFFSLIFDSNIMIPGYSLRKHIAKALKARSQAIRTSLLKYNLAAADLNPPRPFLAWEDVVEYAFLADFDLLRDTRQDVRSRPWATPAGRMAMDSYFKLQRAEEEIIRLNIEIPRLATFMRDENTYLCNKQVEIQASNPALAHQISIHNMEGGRFIKHHTKILNQIITLKGYSGGPLLGTHVPDVEATIMMPTVPVPPVATSLLLPDIILSHEVDREEDLEEEEAGVIEEMEAMGAYYSVIKMSIDSTTT